MCRNTSGKLEKLFNHLYRIYGIHVCIHAYHHNQTHKHGSRIAFERIEAYTPPYTGVKQVQIKQIISLNVSENVTAFHIFINCLLIY